MNAIQLLEHFDRLAEAPDAVPRLRRLILNLAVHGKLVEQNSNDEPASNLLRRDLSEDKKKVTAGPSTDRRQLPAGWTLVSLGSLLSLKKGKKPQLLNESGRGHPYLDIAALERGEIRQYTEDEKCPKATVEDLLIVCDGSRSGLVLDGRNGVIGSTIASIQFAGFSRTYLRVLLNAMYVDLNSEKKGAAIPHLNIPRFLALEQGLPPLAEQHRIVAKVDELMALCDQLEAAQQERDRRRDRLAAASLQRLNQPAADTTHEAQREHARFHLHHLPRLTTRPEHIKALRQTILNLAVQGRLCPQDVDDEPIDALLKRIGFEQRNATELGLLKCRLPASEEELNGCPFPIPAGWRWVKLANLITFGPQNGVSPKEVRDDKAPKAITLTATTSGSFQSANYKHVELSEADCDSYWLSPGDVLFQRGNTREYVGMAAIFDGPLRSFIFPDLMIRVRFSKSVEIRFAHMVMVSPPLRSYFSSIATGASTTMPKINQSMLLNAPIPLPPLAEQHRIVAKVDELMALCDQLEAHLTTTQADSRRLLEAVLEAALAPA